MWSGRLRIARRVGRTLRYQFHFSDWIRAGAPCGVGRRLLHLAGEGEGLQQGVNEMLLVAKADEERQVEVASDPGF